VNHAPINNALPLINYSASSHEELRHLEDTTLLEYGRELWRLLSNVLVPHLRPADNTPFYPVTAAQRIALDGLAHTLRDPSPVLPIQVTWLHDSVFSLFAHEKEHGAADHFSLSTVCFVVARSMSVKGWLSAMEIGRTVAKFMWLIRGVVMYQMQKEMAAELLHTGEYVNLFISCRGTA
jgi:hypothetical protein